MGARILGIGHELPPAVERSGVIRPIAVEPVGPSTLAARASAGALAQAGLAVDAVDFIVFATMTPDVTFPGAACYLQEQLGCGTVGALDIRAQCAGFIYALAVADRFMRAGAYRHVLVAGGEVHSAGLDYSDDGLHIARLFGDGAGVVVLGPADGERGVCSTVLHADGQSHRSFWCEYPASRQHPTRMTLADFVAGRHFPAIDVDAVRRFGIDVLPTVIGEALEAAAVSKDRVDRFIISCLLPDVVDSVARRLGIASTRVANPSAHHGHLTAAALPVALSEAIGSGALAAGATVCLAAAGAGFAWGAAVVTL
jgi:3-oxoacyl-[acyl-carrier-protein] synthase-3